MQINSIRILFGLGLMAVLFAGCGGAEKTTSAGDAANDGDANSGELLFSGQANSEVNCASCHEGDGEGPDLATRIGNLSDEEILTAMEDGKDGMPGFSATLGEKEREHILACLRARFTTPMIEAPKDPGAEPESAE